MESFRLRLISLLAALLLSAGVQAFDADNDSVKKTSFPVIQTNSAGTFFSYDGKTFFLPGVLLPESLQHSLLLAGSDVIYRKLMHYFLQLTLEHTAQYLSEKNLMWYVYTGVPYTLQAWNLAFNILPKARNIAAHGWERTQTSLGWSRRGRMPVYVGGILDSAIFIDVLLNTHESSNSQLKQIELTPLRRVNVENLTSPWQKALGNMTNTALGEGVDTIRITVQSHGDMRLQWHLIKTNQWTTADRFYPAPQQGQEYLTQWLGQSWNTQTAQDGLLTVLDTAGLECITTRFTDQYTQCTPLSDMSAISKTKTSAMTFLLTGDTETTSSYLHIRNNRSPVPGAPGELLITDHQDLSEQDHRHSSSQYRIPRELAYLAEYMIYRMLYNVMDKTIGAGIEYSSTKWHRETDYTQINDVEGLRIPGSIRRVQSSDGTVYIMKSSPMSISNPTKEASIQRYAYLTREAAILNDINGRGAVKIHDSWIKNAGSSNASIVMLLEDGGQDLSQISARSETELKALIKGSTRAVAELHDAGYIHFDIKPENLVINHHNQVKLIDLEMAVKLDPNKPSMPLLFDVRWRSPENKLEQNPSTWRTDIWNLGATALSLFSNSTLPGASEIPNDVTGPTLERSELMETGKLIEQGKKLTSLPNFTAFLKKSLAEDPNNRLPARKLSDHYYLD